MCLNCTPFFLPEHSQLPPPLLTNPAENPGMIFENSNRPDTMVRADPHLIAYRLIPWQNETVEFAIANAMNTPIILTKKRVQVGRTGGLKTSLKTESRYRLGPCIYSSWASQPRFCWD